MHKIHLFLNPLYWPIWLCLGLLWLITRLPDRAQLMCGKWLGCLIRCCSRKLRTITQTNLTLCFPELTSTARTQLLRANFHNVGIGIIEAARAFWLPTAKLCRHFNLQGSDNIAAAHARGKGVLIVGAHFTCLEMVGRLFALHHDFAIIYRPHKLAVMNFLYHKFRMQHYHNSIPRQDMRRVVRALKKNEAVWYTYDVDAGRDSNSVFAPFFGIQTASLTALPRLTHMTDAAIVFIHYRRKPGSFDYEVTLSPRLENFPTDNVIADATRLNARLETQIRAQPDQYMWQYKRFKTRPPGEARFYHS